MRILTRLLVVIVASGSAVAVTAAAELPWKVNTPIVKVKRVVFRKHPKPKTAAWSAISYAGPGLVRQEIYTTMATSDTPVGPRRRWSTDNGRTWSDSETLPEVVTHPQGVRVYWGNGPAVYDPDSKRTVSIWLRQTKLKGVYYNQLFVRLSRDLGRTWSDGKQLAYEPGDVFDPASPFKPGFLQCNQAYFGNNVCRHSNGTLIVAGAATNIPKGVPIPNPGGLKVGGIPADARSIGSLCFAGKWNAARKDYDWKAGKPVWVSRDVSSRGLMEPEVAELKDKRVLVVWRTSNAGLDDKKRPGRKRFSVSSDGGMTLSQPKELRYDDGSEFYSPSSFHRMIRHTVTGKLYWIGNISAGLARGNSPRYPLVIAEVDESKPALKHNTATRIGGRGPKDSARVQLSNFSLLENRQTHELEIYLTRIGENPKDFWGADIYKYTLQLVK